MACQLLVDLYGCNSQLVDDPVRIRELAHKIIADINSDIVEECSHHFSPYGVTYIAVITTSHFSVHTWPEYNYAAIDIFSCNEDLPEILANMLKEAFDASDIVYKKIERNISHRKKMK